MMKENPMRLIVAPVVLLLALTSCVPPIKPAEIAALESGLTAADRAALVYLTLPACPVSAPVCADAAIKLKIKTTEMTAYTAVKKLEEATAENRPALLAVAQAAVSVYLTTIPKPAATN